MSTYYVRFGADTLNVHLIAEPSFLRQKLAEFKYFLRRRIVGVSFYKEYKCVCNGALDTSSSCLLLCSGRYCLVINWGLLRNVSKDIFKDFLLDKTICFAALDSDAVISGLDDITACKTCVRLGYLASRALHIFEAQSYKLEQLAALVDVDLKPRQQSLTSLKWSNAIYFSEEEMKCAVHDVYYTFVIAYKLLID